MEKVLIKTRRLSIRRLMLADLNELAPILADPEVMRFSVAGPKTAEQTRAFIHDCFKSYQRFGFSWWAVIHNDDNKLIGIGGILAANVDSHMRLELAYRLARSYWGQGLGTEVAQGILEYGFNKLGINHMISIIAPENAASSRIAEKLGMAYENDTIYKGHPVRIYAISKF